MDLTSDTLPFAIRSPVVNSGAIGKDSFFIYGPIAIGTFIGLFLCGGIVLGTILYLDRYRHEHVRAACLLLFVAALNVAQSASDCSRLLKITIYHPNIAYFIDIHARPEELISPVLNMLICTTVQIFLVHRCLFYTRMTMSPAERGTVQAKRKLWTMGALLGICVMLCFGSGIGTTVALELLPNYIYANRDIDTNGAFPTLATIWLSATAGTDVLICLIIIHELWTINRKKASPNRMITALIKVAFQSGVVVTTLQIATLITYLKHTEAWSDFTTIFIAKIYSLTLLASHSSPRRAVSPEHNRKSPRSRHTNNIAIPLTIPRVVDSWRARASHIAFPSPSRRSATDQGVMSFYADNDASRDSLEVDIHRYHSSREDLVRMQARHDLIGETSRKTSRRSGKPTEEEEEKVLGVLDLV